METKFGVTVGGGVYYFLTRERAEAYARTEAENDGRTEPYPVAEYPMEAKGNGKI